MSEDPGKKKTFHGRGLTSFVVLETFLLLLITGIVLYITPQGRVARWSDWRVLGLSKEQWSGIHMAIAAIFIVASVFHIYFNWRVLISYFKKKLQRGFHLKIEFAVATALTVLAVATTLYEVPPFGTLIAWNDDIKVYWEARSAPAPYPHAEDSTLAEFAENTGADLDGMLQNLAKAKIKGAKPAIKIGKLAAQNGMPPSALFPLMKGEKTGASDGGGHGMGLGRKTLETYCSEQGIDLDTAIATLKTKGITAKPTDPLKNLATDLGGAPADVIDLID